MSYDVIILGVGAMGSAAADQLSRRGLRVLGLEQFDIPNSLASSHGESRMIRTAYFEHPDYVPLLRRAYELWHELEARTNERLLHLTGGLYIGPTGSELVSGSLRAAREHGLQHELLNDGDLRSRFEAFDVPDDHIALFEPMAGLLEPERCVAAYAKMARRQGVELREQVTVRSWSSDRGGVIVKTDTESYSAKQLLITAGAWTSQVLTRFPVKLEVTRQSLAWFEPAAPSRFRLGEFPVWAFHRPAGGIYYGFPIVSEAMGMKLAIHSPGEQVDPDMVDRSIHQHEIDELLQFVRDHFPAGAGPLRAHTVCLYTNSPDGNFIVDRLPDQPNVTIACGFSGHGFKFASVMGEVLADLVIGGKSTQPSQFLSLDRLRQG